MALDQTVRDLVAFAHSFLGDEGFEATVQHEAVVTVGGVVQRDAYGEPQRGAPVARACVLEDVNRIFRTASGEEQVAVSRLTFLADVAVTTEDAFELADGRRPPVVRVDRGLDPSGGPYVTVVYLGA